MPKQHFEFRTPILNAAGMLGFSPSARLPIPLEILGAFVTNPISYQARKPAISAGINKYPGGVLLHNGHPNPGIKSALRRHRGRWQRAPLPIIVHLLSASPTETANCVRMLEEVENVMGVEIGLPHDISAEAASEIVAACAGELPLMVRLPLSLALQLAPAVIDAGASVISLAPPRGALAANNESVKFGRLYGPGIFPLALATVSALSQLPVEVIGAGGVYSQEQVDAMLKAGAAVVQLDTLLWRGDWTTTSKKQTDNSLII